MPLDESTDAVCMCTDKPEKPTANAQSMRAISVPSAAHLPAASVSSRNDTHTAAAVLPKKWDITRHMQSPTTAKNTAKEHILSIVMPLSEIAVQAISDKLLL